MISSFTGRWQAKYAETLLAQAMRETGHPRPRLTFRLAVCWVLSVIVLISPLLVGGFGLAVIWTTFPRVLPLIIGLILLGFAYILLPPINRNHARTYRREELPTLFALLDQIAERLGTTAPDGVHFDTVFNAYMGQYRSGLFGRQDWILGIGLPLWAAASEAEKLAILTHELGHKVNDDPLRQGVFFQAKSVLTTWQYTFEMRSGDAFGGALAQLVFAAFVSGYDRVLSWFSFFESQRAEYRADAAAARVAGRQAMQSALVTLTRQDLSNRAMLDLYPYRDNQNGRIFDHMGHAVSEADPALVTRYLDLAAAEKHRVDSSHPPTTLRLAFLEALPGGWDADPLDAARCGFESIAAEIQPIKDALGKALMEDLHETEFDR